MTTATKGKTAKSKTGKKAIKPVMVLDVHRQTFNVSVHQHGPRKFVWWAQQSGTYFSEDEPQPGDLNETGEAKSLQAAAQAAFDALADHIDVE